MIKEVATYSNNLYVDLLFHEMTYLLIYMEHILTDYNNCCGYYRHRTSEIFALNPHSKRKTKLFFLIKSISLHKDAAHLSFLPPPLSPLVFHTFGSIPLAVLNKHGSPRPAGRVATFHFA